MGKWIKEKKFNISAKFITLLFSPLISVLVSISHLKTKSSFIVLYLIFILFGASLTVPNVRTEKFNFDGVAYRIEFESYQRITTENFYKSFVDYLRWEGSRDFYADIIYFLISRISNNYHLMFFLISVVFSFFMLKSLKIFVWEDNYKNSLVCFLLLYTFLINQIININAFRFFTAAWISIFALLNLMVFKKRVYVLLLAVVPFFHASFFALYVMLILYWVLRKWCKVLIIVLICSFFLSEFSTLILNENINLLPPLLGERLSVYMNENYMYQINEAGSGFIGIKRFIEFVTRLYVNILILVMFFDYKKKIWRTKCENLFYFLLVLMIFVNFTIIIPSVGSRFLYLAFPLISYIWLVRFSEHKYNKYIYVLGVILLIQFIMPFSIYVFPCLKYYCELWDMSFFVLSPFYSFVKYIFFY